MEKPGKKLKKFFLILGTTGAVYAGFQYLLPLVAPFFIGYMIALLLRPSARFLSYRIRVTFRGKTRHLPLGAAGGGEFLLLLTAAVAGLGRLCQGIGREARQLAARLPQWMENLDQNLTAVCASLEQIWGLEPGTASGQTVRLIQAMVQGLRESVFPGIMANSWGLFQWGAQALIGAVVTFLAVVLSLQEMDQLRWRRDRSLFRREFARISRRLLQTGKAWFKTQGLTFLAVSLICVAGMALIGNPYYMLAGIGVGILDALPIFGTGTVLIPWAILCFFGARWGRGLFLLGLYLVCCFVREFLETRMMSAQVGLSPLETLAAVYVGLQLFGFFGFLLGPLGLLIIEDLIEGWEQDQGELH